MSFQKSSDGLIINTDDSQYKSILALRSSEKMARELDEKVKTLDSELREIKALLMQSINRN